MSSFTSSTKREIRHFHVVVLQRQQRNAKKRVMHVQSCYFVAFLPFSLPSPSSLVKPPVVAGNHSLAPNLVPRSHSVFPFPWPWEIWVRDYLAPCKVIQIPESGKSLLVESEILGFGIGNSTQESVIPITIGI